MSHSGMSRTVLQLYKAWLSKDRERATKERERSGPRPHSHQDRSETAEKSQSEESNYTRNRRDPEKTLNRISVSDSTVEMIRGNFLSAEERETLLGIVRRPSERHSIGRRANALLLLDDGLSCESVAKVLYLDDDTIRGWHKSYVEGGWEALRKFG